jgi:hypothetical protein
MKNFEELLQNNPHFNPDKSVIKIHGFTYTTVNDRGVTMPSMQISPDQPSFLALGPRAFAKLYVITIINSLESIQRKIRTVPLNEVTFLGSIMKECKRISLVLYRLCSLLPTGRIYPLDRITNNLPKIHIQVENGTRINTQNDNIQC